MDECEKILSRMKQTRFGWHPEDFEHLYTGFGFRYNEGGGHRVYQHPRYPQLIATVARHRKLAPSYAKDAIRLIETLKQLEKTNEPKSH